jgi:kinesin family protein 11
MPSVNPSNTGLREVDANVVARPPAHSTDDKTSAGQSTSVVDSSDNAAEADDMNPPPPKRRRSNSVVLESKLPQKMFTKKMAGMMEGRENVPPTGVSSGRRLRNRPSP